MSLLRRVARKLRIGKEKYFVGTDLEGNSFYERPSVENPEDWRQRKRTVDYAVTRHLSEYQFYSLPVQWSAWLRRTRYLPPTIPELQADVLRQRKLQSNVERLQIAYKEEKERLALANEEVKRVESGGKMNVELERERSGVKLEDGPEAQAEREKRRKESQQETQRLRNKFAMEQSKTARNPSSAYQPDSWDGNKPLKPRSKETL